MTSDKSSVSEMANKWENTQYFSICFLKANDYLRIALKICRRIIQENKVKKVQNIKYEIRTKKKMGFLESRVKWKAEY